LFSHITVIRIFIIGELAKNGQSAENLKRLKEELQKVKTDLSNAEGKRQHLQNELEQITKAKEDAESRLKTKQDVLANLGELVEAELQCSICSELFVTVSA
jgi:E3 ubiquitin-protein ligase RNF8